MREMAGRLATDPELAAAVPRRARGLPGHAGDARRRAADRGITAGGMPDRVKCLHALAGARAGRRARGQPDRRRAVAEMGAGVVGGRALRHRRGGAA